MSLSSLMGLITDFFKGNMSASPSRKPRICTLKARRNAAKQRHASAFFAARRAEERYKKAMRLEESLLEEANQARAHDQWLQVRREKTLAQIRSGLVKIITIE